MNKKATLGVLFVFIGCCSNVIFLEALVQQEPGCGSLMTAMQFTFVALQGFIWTMNFGTKKRVIPLMDYIKLALMFLIINELNNRVFAYKISMPLHIIFRSGGLIASMILGMMILGRRYSIQKYISVISITIGTILATLASSGDINKHSAETLNTDMKTWLMGIAILTFAMFLQARMGIFQECLYKVHGKHPEEALFYFHSLSLPMFLLAYQSISDHVVKFNSSEILPQVALVTGMAVPKMWIYAIAYVLTQFICIKSVFVLTSECSSLTVMLVLTLRKFMSLLFSIVYFQNAFTFLHWVGAALVFGGTIMFSEPFYVAKTKSQ